MTSRTENCPSMLVRMFSCESFCVAYFVACMCACQYFLWFLSGTNVLNRRKPFGLSYLSRNEAVTQTKSIISFSYVLCGVLFIHFLVQDGLLLPTLVSRIKFNQLIVVPIINELDETGCQLTKMFIFIRFSMDMLVYVGKTIVTDLSEFFLKTLLTHFFKPFFLIQVPF